MSVNWARERRLAKFALFSVVMSGGLIVAAFYLMKKSSLKSTDHF